MKWQRITALLVGGASLLALTLWLTHHSHSSDTKKPAQANARVLTNIHSPARPIVGRQRAANGPRRPLIPRGLVNRNVRRPMPGAKPNPRLSRAGVTNGPPAAAKGAPTWSERFARLRENPYFYPAVAFTPLLLGVFFLLLASKSKSKEATPATDSAQPLPTVSPRLAKRKRGRTAVRACNVLQTGPEERRVWQFGARGGGLALNREHVARAGQPLPTKVVAKEWQSLWQPKLNVAWLPPQQVFFRVAQFPMADFAETVAMVELQLEKLSPIPVAQVAWTMQVLPHPETNMQTVIVVLVARSVVEEFLGQLEQQGYIADRLELSFVDQLQATTVSGSGAWVYPIAGGVENRALVAWWYDGVLRDLGMVVVPATGGTASLREQLLQLAWAGELDGWLTSAPSWHLVAGPESAAHWEPALREALGEPMEVLVPLDQPKLATLTARRAAEAEPQLGLLPPEFATRYRQQFVDRLWMRGLGAALALYAAGVAIYMMIVQVALFRTRAVENQVEELATQYTNTMQLKAQMGVLKKQQNLKYAALDCWLAVADLLPADVTLDSFNFSDGHTLTLTGTAPPDSAQELFQFDGSLLKATAHDQPLFDPTKSQIPNTQLRGTQLTWSLQVELKHGEAE